MATMKQVRAPEISKSLETVMSWEAWRIDAGITMSDWGVNAINAIAVVTSSASKSVTRSSATDAMHLLRGSFSNRPSTIARTTSPSLAGSTKLTK